MIICIHLHSHEKPSVGKIRSQKDNSRFGWVIRSFPLQAKRVSYIVFVLFVEFVVRNLAEGLAPKHKGFLDW